jgi:hypothetical protein
MRVDARHLERAYGAVLVLMGAGFLVHAVA